MRTTRVHPGCDDASFSCAASSWIRKFNTSTKCTWNATVWQPRGHGGRLRIGGKVQLLEEITDPVPAIHSYECLSRNGYGSLIIASATEFHADPFEFRDPLPGALAAHAQNLLRFPDHNAEGRALVADTTARIADAATRAQPRR